MILEMIQSDDIMITWEGLNTLSQALNISEEKSLAKFQYELFCQKLISVIKQPSIYDLSNDVKFSAIKCILTIIDIFPQHVGYLVSIDAISTLKETIEQSMGFIDLVENCIKCVEKISLEFPREVLKQGLLQMAFNMIDFLDKGTQLKIIKLLVNVSGSSECIEDFQQNLLPILPNICQMLQQQQYQQTDQDKSTFQNLAIVLEKITDSFTVFANPELSSMDSLFKQLILAGVYETIIEILRKYSIYVQTTSKQQNISSTQQLINTSVSDQKQQFSIQSISNMLKVLTISCSYSIEVLTQLTSIGIFQIIEPLMFISSANSSESNQQNQEISESQISVLSDVLSLIESILPSNIIVNQTQSLKPVVLDNFDDIFGENEDNNKDQKEEKQQNSEDQNLLIKVKEQREKYETDKKIFFQNQEHVQLHNLIAKSLLPKVFTAYSHLINVSFRTKCLILIQKMLYVIPQSLLKENFDPAIYTKFIHTILRQQQPEQVLYCLQTVLMLLESEYGTQLSIYFIRHGIRETILEYTKDGTIQQLNQFQPVRLSKQNTELKDRLQENLHERKRINEQQTSFAQVLKEENLPSQKKEEVKKMMRRAEDILRSLDKQAFELKKLQDLQTRQFKDFNTQDNSFGTQISEIAKTIKDKYIENESYWSNNVQQQHPDELGFFQKLTDLANDLLDQASKIDFDQQKYLSLMNQISLILSQNNGLTSYEFSKSGLLNAIQILLTKSPSNAKNKQDDSQIEESKTIQQPQQKSQIDEKEAISFFIKTKHLIDALCNKTNNKLPFRELLNLCHDQITLAEPIIFKESTQGQFDPLSSQSRNVIVKLVYQNESQDKQEEDQSSQIHSQVYLKRDKLYKLLKEFPIPVRIADNLSLVQDFLIKRTCSEQDVNHLVNQAQRHFGMNRLSRFTEENQQENILKPEYQELHDKIMNRIIELAEECIDQDMFDLVKEPVLIEIVTWIQEWENESQIQVNEQFFKHLQTNTTQIVGQMAEEEQQEFDQNDIPDEEKELIQEAVQMKTESFVQLISQIRQKSFSWEKFKKLDKTQQVAQLPESSFESIELKEEEMMSSHQHVLIKHPPNHHTGWRCDRITGSQICRSYIHTHNSKGKQGWRCNQCDFDLCISCMKVNRFFDNEQLKTGEGQKVEVQEDKSLSLNELLKTEQDVEIQFFFNKKLIDPNTSFQDIFAGQEETKEKTPNKNPLFGSDHDFKILHFSIKEKNKVQIEENQQQKGVEEIALQDLTQIKIDEQSDLKSFVENMIEIVDIKDLNTNNKTQKLEGDDSAITAILNQTLRLFKSLSFLHQKSYIFTQISANLLLKTVGSTYQFNSTDPSIDANLKNLSNEVKQNAFHHVKLDVNFQKTLAMRLGTGQIINNKLKIIFSSCTSLFSYESKLLYLRLVGFLSVDSQRASFYIRQNMMKKIGQNGRIPLNGGGQEKPIERQKIMIDRSQSLIEQALKFFPTVKRRAILEVAYIDEEGVGLGPTQEFYSLLGLQLRQEKSLWRSNTADGMLYPSSIQMNQNNKEEIQKIVAKFELIGAFVARAILDDRLIDLPISNLMWERVFDKKQNLCDLQRLDNNLFQIFQELQQMACEKKRVDETEDLNQESKQELYNKIRSSKDASVEDYALSFYNPANDEVLLLKDGADKSVTLDNLQNYIDLFVQSTFDSSVSLQIQAFKRGFNSVMPIECIQLFAQSGFGELETLICGQLNESGQSEWTDTNKLSQVINTAHGFNANSKSFLYFLQYVSEIKPEDRSAFLQFITGSPRLPMGGFAALDPRLTVVLKKPERHQKQTQDQMLPSVNTCQNYVKMPEYSSYELLKQKFDLAVREGSVGFSLS